MAILKSKDEFRVSHTPPGASRPLEGAFTTRVKLTHRQRIALDDITGQYAGSAPRDSMGYATAAAYAWCMVYLEPKATDPTWWKPINLLDEDEDGGLMLAVCSAGRKAVREAYEAYEAAVEKEAEAARTAAAK